MKRFNTLKIRAKINTANTPVLEYLLRCEFSDSKLGMYSSTHKDHMIQYSSAHMIQLLVVVIGSYIYWVQCIIADTLKI